MFVELSTKLTVLWSMFVDVVWGRPVSVVNMSLCIRVWIRGISLV